MLNYNEAVQILLSVAASHNGADVRRALVKHVGDAISLVVESVRQFPLAEELRDALLRIGRSWHQDAARCD